MSANHSNSNIDDIEAKKGKGERRLIAAPPSPPESPELIPARPAAMYKGQPKPGSPVTSPDPLPKKMGAVWTAEYAKLAKANLTRQNSQLFDDGVLSQDPDYPVQMSLIDQNRDKEAKREAANASSAAAAPKPESESKSDKGKQQRAKEVRLIEAPKSDDDTESETDEEDVFLFGEVEFQCLASKKSDYESAIEDVFGEAIKDVYHAQKGAAGDTIQVCYVQNVITGELDILTVVDDDTKAEFSEHSREADFHDFVEIALNNYEGDDMTDKLKEALWRVFDLVYMHIKKQKLPQLPSAEKLLEICMDNVCMELSGELLSDDDGTAAAATAPAASADADSKAPAAADAAAPADSNNNKRKREAGGGGGGDAVADTDDAPRPSEAKKRRRIVTEEDDDEDMPEHLEL